MKTLLLLLLLPVFGNAQTRFQAFENSGTTSEPDELFMGLGTTDCITPVSTGNVLVIMSGTYTCSVAGGGVSLEMHFYDGYAWGFEDDEAGTAVGPAVEFFTCCEDSPQSWTITRFVTGLTLNEGYTFDLTGDGIGSGNAYSLNDVSIFIFEL